MTPDANHAIDSELLHKMITRTDSYLNYANTKSTIIITFITAMVAAIGTHAGNALHYLNEKNHPDLIIVFKVLIFVAIVLLLFGFYHAGKSVMPYTRPSERKNFFSFIDTIHHYSSEEAYAQDVKSMRKDDVAESLISLQYNLSAGLVKKYDMHRKAIHFILYSLAPICTCILILLFI
ncbi:TPA: hypothetical protein JHJ80_000111 [Enterobacter cloacae]|uniref:Pycsar system effector family protein n=1 Tax=Enterobacter cloacae TaxID=550 RepID=UPI00293063DA|nr:Pycsar system effector family protein [Enterobacter cloacae]HAV2059542.1 hypothetical protein [Enterobacter cloacae]